jgi:hypothetical protein
VGNRPSSAVRSGIDSRVWPGGSVDLPGQDCVWSQSDERKCRGGRRRSSDGYPDPEPPARRARPLFVPPLLFHHRLEARDLASAMAGLK